MSTTRKTDAWPDQATTKRNRWQTQRPRRGRWWCYGCDANLVQENERCQVCGIRVRRSSVKPGLWP